MNSKQLIFQLGYLKTPGYFFESLVNLAMPNPSCSIEIQFSTLTSGSIAFQRAIFCSKTWVSGQFLKKNRQPHNGFGSFISTRDTALRLRGGFKERVTCFEKSMNRMSSDVPADEVSLILVGLQLCLHRSKSFHDILQAANQEKTTGWQKISSPFWPTKNHCLDGDYLIWLGLYPLVSLKIHNSWLLWWFDYSMVFPYFAKTLLHQKFLSHHFS